MYQLSYQVYDGTRHTNPHPSLGLILKEYFDNQANYTLKLAWVDETHHIETFQDVMWFDSSKDMEKGRFSIKVIQIGDNAQLLSKNPDENGSVIESMQRITPEEKLNVYVIRFQLHQVEPFNLNS